jgi:hypothetical protein
MRGREAKALRPNRLLRCCVPTSGFGDSTRRAYDLGLQIVHRVRRSWCRRLNDGHAHRRRCRRGWSNGTFGARRNDLRLRRRREWRDVRRSRLVGMRLERAVLATRVSVALGSAPVGRSFASGLLLLRHALRDTIA